MKYKGRRKLYSALNKLDNQFEYIDLFDESDKLFSYTYQLIYTIGSQMPLDYYDRVQVNYISSGICHCS